MPIHPIIDPAAVEGDAPGGFGSGVRGRNSIGEAEGVLGGTDPVLFQPVGAYGMSNNQGVVGLSKGDGAGVFGSNNSNGPKGRGVQGNGPEAGVGGFSDAGNGVLAQSKTGIAILAQGGGKAGRFEGDVEVTGGLAVGTDVVVSGDIRLPQRDIAELFPARPDPEVVAGSVMVIGSDGALAASTEAYDTRVVGIVSSDGDLRPAIVLGADHRDTAASIAMVGTTHCLVDASDGAILPGDLLVSGRKKGHAMKALNPDRRVGAIIGKSLGRLDEGQGVVRIVVTLQ